MSLGDIFLAHGHQRLDDRMTPLFDVDARPVVQFGAHELRCARCGRTTGTVDARHGVCIAQQLGQRLRNEGDQRIVNLLFERQDAVFGTENLLFVLLQFPR